jgi:hypothetical protein
VWHAAEAGVALMPEAIKSGLMTKRDLGSVVTKVLNHLRLSKQLIGDRERELAKLNRLTGGESGLLEAAFSVLRTLAETSEDEEIRLNAAKALRDGVLDIQNAIQSARVRVAELAVQQQMHVDNLQVKLMKESGNDAPIDGMTDAQLLETAGAKAQ